MKSRQPVDYERAAEAMAAAGLMPSDPDVVDRQQREAEAYVAEVRRRVIDEEARHRYRVQQSLLCQKVSA